MTAAELAKYTCRHCGKSFSEGRKLGGHIRQSHPLKVTDVVVSSAPLTPEGELAARVLEMWKNGNEPYKIVTSLRVHPGFIKGVLKEYDELLNEWKKSTEVTATHESPRTDKIDDMETVGPSSHEKRER